jgi:MFS family permease
MGAQVSTKRAGRPIFYGWWVLVVLFVSGSLVYGGGLYSFVLLVAPWTREFGWSRAATSGLVSAFWLSAPFVLVGARAIERLGVSRLLVAGVAIEAIGVCLLPLAHTLPQMYALRAIMGFGKVSFGVALPVIIAVWFKRKFSLALGVAWAGWSIGGLVFAPISSVIVDRYGWRTDCFAIGACLGLFALVPLTLILRVKCPAELGYGKDGYEEMCPNLTVADGPRAESAKSVGGVDVRSLLSLPAFWGIAIGTVAFYAAYAGALTQQAALVEEAGYSTQTASLILGSTAALAAASGPIVGSLLDRVPAFGVLMLIEALLLVSVLTLSIGAHFRILPVFVLYSVMFGVAVGGADVSWVALMRQHFPNTSVAQSFSAWYFVQIITLALAPIAVGYVYDKTGSYDRTIFALAGSCVLSIVLVIRGQKRLLTKVIR